jgi:prolyl 4-hydroxylase
MLDNSHRTSTFFGFKKLHDTKVAALEQRIADLLGCWVHQIEALQLVRYFPGQFFGIHHDMGDLLGDDEVILPQKQLGVKRRLVTLFCYLNTLDKDQGGCTYFPQCDIRVLPKKGRAVLFSNVTSAGLPDPYTIHAGEAVESNNKSVVKYGLNIWICEE